VKDPEINSQFARTLRFVNETGRSVFLTGKAGTGKTTLLKYVRENCFKQMAVIAPTGVAAINAGGSTIHSFLQLPFGPYLPHMKKDGDADLTRPNLPEIRHTGHRLSVYRNLELLIIDEISMVRADLLDQIDAVLRATRKKTHLPFGGVQVMLIGDMYQLAPVVPQAEKKILAQVYRNFFFFDSFVMKADPPVYIELEKIYRQSDQKFIGLLNKVRNNALDKGGIELLNSHFKERISEEEYKANVTLTTHNRKADEINGRNLNAIKSGSYTYKAETDGIFPEKMFPADENLELKIGARVMFLKNNNEKNYFNGKMGTVSYLDNETLHVRCDDEKESTVVIRETWNNVSYQSTPNGAQVTEDVIGTFKQFPVRLAWAITIHKSQGLTFNKLIIDAAEAFSAGQVYVALSRCRSLDGLILSSRIAVGSLYNDRSIVDFSLSKPNEVELQSLFENDRRGFIRSQLSVIFGTGELKRMTEDLLGITLTFEGRIPAAGKEWCNDLSSKINGLDDLFRKFNSQLDGIFRSSVDPESDPLLQERIAKAAGYFGPAINELCSGIENTPFVTESVEVSKEISPLLQEMYRDLFLSSKIMNLCLSGFQLESYIRSRSQIRLPEKKIEVYAKGKNTRDATTSFSDLESELIAVRDEICEETGKPIYMVAGGKTIRELAAYLPQTEAELMLVKGFGPVKVKEFGEVFLAVIRSYTRDHNVQIPPREIDTKKTKVVKRKQKIQRADTPVPTHEKTFELFKKGLPIREIAETRRLTVNTIESHLLPFVARGEIDINNLVTKEKREKILEELEDFSPTQSIKAVKDKLPEDISYSEIRFMIAEKFRH
jgi:hypothetical protein